MNGKWTVENFNEYDAKNPEIYSLFKRFALEASTRKTHYSAKIIFHRIRWETMLSGKDSEFKIDDGWISHYARKFLKEFPNLDGFFKTRVRSKSYHNADHE